jgi:hypothetical protein
MKDEKKSIIVILFLTLLWWAFIYAHNLTAYACQVVCGIKDDGGKYCQCVEVWTW